MKHLVHTLTQQLALTALITTLWLLAGCGQPPEPLGAAVAPVAIQTVPEGAQILAGGEVLGVTPQELELSASEWHLLELRLPGYESHFVQLRPVQAEASGYDPIRVELIPILAPAYITSSPPDALVRLDGVDRGSTPLVIPDLALGEHELVLTAPGFANKRQSFEVTSSQPLRIDVNMESIIGTLEIYSTPGNADIIINGTARGTTPSDGTSPLVVGELDAGNYEVTASRPGYNPVTRSVLLPRNATRQVRLPAMQPLPGAVTISSSPAGAKVHNRNTGELLGETPLTLENLPDGDITFTISRDGFEAEERTVTITQGIVRHIDATLRNNRGSVAFITEPPGVRVFIDGRRAGETEPADTPLVSQVFTEHNLRPGPHQLNLVRPGYENFSREFFVERGRTENLGTIRLTKQWIPTHVLKIHAGPTYRGILVTRYPDGSVEFERSRNIKVTYEEKEIEYLRELKNEDVD